MPTSSGPLGTSKLGVVEVDTVAHYDDTTAGDYVNSLTFTELFSGWTESRTIWNTGSEAIVEQLKELEASVPFSITSFHSDSGSELLNGPLRRYLTGSH